MIAESLLQPDKCWKLLNGKWKLKGQLKAKRKLKYSAEQDFKQKNIFRGIQDLS